MPDAWLFLVGPTGSHQPRRVLLFGPVLFRGLPLLLLDGPVFGPGCVHCCSLFWFMLLDGGQLVVIIVGQMA